MSTTGERATSTAAVNEWWTAPWRAVQRFGSSLSLAGILLGTLAFAASTQPSLVPRGWVFQGAISGLSLLIGYGIGVLARWLLRVFGLDRVLPERLHGRVHAGALALFAVVAVVTLLTGAASQRRLAAAWDMEPTAGAHLITTLLLTLAVFTLVLAAGRGLRSGARALRRLLNRWIPRPVSAVVSFAVVTALAVTLVNGLFHDVVLGSITPGFQRGDSEVAPGYEPPSAPERSGSPESGQAWDTLGYQGRIFAAGGPTAEEITAVTGRSAMTPIRLYAGLASQDAPATEVDLDALAEEVVAELDRTNAWARSVLVVTTATGTGWVDPLSAAAVEYVTDGDVAIASMQYSYNPSWVTLVLDLDRPRLAGQALFEAVSTRWQELPEDDRPLLLSYGVSLGSYGSQSSFTSVGSVAARSDGAVWAGTPYFTPFWTGLTRDRDPGTLQKDPVLDGGATARWGIQSSGSQGYEDLGPAEGARIAYLQHPSDGVVWWWFPTFWHKDPWFDEPHIGDTISGVRWYPIITGLQLMGDQFAAGSPTVPLGHGHNYAGGYVDAWSWATARSLPEDELEALRKVVIASPRDG